MNDNQYVICIKEQAIEYLLTETFSHVHKMMHDEYVALVEQNNHLQKCKHRLFYSAGAYYPPDLAETESTRYTPSLHAALLSRLDEINNFMADRHYHYIKNYFSAVISHSHNKIVLNEMLPTTLLNTLRTDMSKTAYQIIDSGFYGSSYQEPIALTIENLNHLKKHYSETLKKLQTTLMEKLLLN